jgi:site-specific DNA-methyltransferase (adenine-specific)
MERVVRATTAVDDVVWEPFGGLASASVAAVALGRRAHVAELDPQFARIATERLNLAAQSADPEEEEVAVLAATDATSTPE